VPYTTMITLPAGTLPAAGFVRLTTCPTRMCLPTTVNPSLTSSSRALVNVIPTTSGTGTRGGALAGGLAVGLADGGAAVEVAGDVGRELARVTEGDVTEGDVREGAAAVECRVAAAELGLAADAPAATGVAVAACPAAAVVVTPPLAASPRPLGELLSRHAVTDPASSRTSRPATARAPRPARHGRGAGGRGA
jgi:hypothetical protein